MLPRLAGLWSGPAQGTPLGAFPLLDRDLAAAGGRVLFGCADLNAQNDLRFVFFIETRGVLVYRNGGYLRGLLRDLGRAARAGRHRGAVPLSRRLHARGRCDLSRSVSAPAAPGATEAVPLLAQVHDGICRGTALLDRNSSLRATLLPDSGDGIVVAPNQSLFSMSSAAWSRRAPVRLPGARIAACAARRRRATASCAMDAIRLRQLLEEVASGATSVDDALGALRRLPFTDLGFAKVDHHRALRTGVPEVVLSEGKETGHLVAVVTELAQAGQSVLCTRCTPAQAEAVRARLPEAVYHALPRLLTLSRRPAPRRGRGEVLVLSAGTSDLRVAEEAAIVAEHLGCCVGRLYDVGVAGLHRLLAQAERLQRAAALIVVAGMEGALPSVAAGVSGRPVIAVPTSVGYGASFHGLAALLGMLTSCAAGVTVVNIDNGFGAGYFAALAVGASDGHEGSGGTP